MRLLLIEDDRVIARNIKALLSRDIYAIDTAFTGKAGISKAIDEMYDIIVVDWMLPDMDGPTVCRKLRLEGVRVAILMLTAKSQTEDVVQGLNAGADDYLTKPFVASELVARIKALSRRAVVSPVLPVITIGDLIIDTTVNRVTRAGKLISLSPKEFSLLHYLALHAGKSLDRMTLLSHVWDDQTDIFTNTVDVHIRYLRRKIDDPFRVKLIRTVKGKGYLLCAD